MTKVVYQKISLLPAVSVVDVRNGISGYCIQINYLGQSRTHFCQWQIIFTGASFSQFQ